MKTKDWKWFQISEIFEIYTGKDLVYMDCHAGNYPVVGHSIENNGIVCKTAFLENYPLQNHFTTISLAHIGNFYATTQTQDFYLGTRTKALKIKFNNVKQECLLFICVLINSESYRFSYGRVGSDKIPSLQIKLPIDVNGNIDWQWIENYVKEVLIPKLPQKAKTVWQKQFDTKPLSSQKLELKTDEWEWFDYYGENGLFQITGSTTTSKDILEESGSGTHPYVTTQAVNNGIEGYFNIATEKGNVFTVDSAVLGFCAYQEKDFSASDHVEKLIPKFRCSKYIAMFLTTIINREQYRYNYGRKASQTKLRLSKIKLPAILNAQGKYEPDWQWMEDYIKGLPYSGCL
ncbi:MAG: restriction endonuclease subunit S [Bacteroidales bacterium]|nr:restriction endonuclease subunit S [Bacteroidales bacterium]